MNKKTAVFVLIFFSLFFFRDGAAQTENRPTILITEIAYDTFQEDALNEWVELLVISDQPLDGPQIKIGDEEEIGGGEGMMRFPKGTVLQPGQVIVIAQSAVDFRAEIGVYPNFEFTDSTADVPNMINVSLLAKGDIAFANSGDEVIVLDEQNRPIDRISYGDKTTYLNPPIQPVAAGYSLERVPPNCDSDTAADFRPQQFPTPLLVPDFGDCPVAEVEPTPEPESFSGPKIGALQGIGDSGSKVNQTVTFQGVVTAIAADKNAGGVTFYTLFVQDFGDSDPQTADGMPVFFGRKRPIFQVGDLVEVNGQVIEYFGLTEIADDGLTVTKIDENRPLPTPVVLQQAGADADGTQQADRTQQAASLPMLMGEHLEGMLVSLDEAIVAGPTFETDAGCGFAVVPVGVVENGRLPFIRHSAEADLPSVIPVLPNDDRDCDEMPPLKVGDRVSGLMGPLTWNFGEWKVIQQGNFQVEAGPPLPLPDPMQLTEGQVSLASLNLENYFDTVDDTEDDAEPKPSAEQIAIREQKFTHLVSKWIGCPTLIAVQEVENRALLEQLAQAIEPACAFRYGVAHIESYDGRGIDNALLFDPNRVTVEDTQLRQTCSRINTNIDPQGFGCPAGQEPLFSRPPFEVSLIVDGRPMIVFVNHFKSKRGGERETAPRRLAQGKFLLGLVEERAGENVNIAVVGDFNDFADSPTLLAMTESPSLENVLRRLPENEQYTFNFGGMGQLIDGILLTPELANRVESVHILHLNANYPDAFQLDVSADHLSFKSTDHDVPIVIFAAPVAETEGAVQAESDAAEVANERPILVEASDVTDAEKVEDAGIEWGRFVWLLPLVAFGLSAVVVFAVGRRRRK